MLADIDQTGKTGEPQNRNVVALVKWITTPTASSIVVACGALAVSGCRLNLCSRNGSDMQMRLPTMTTSTIVHATTIAISGPPLKIPIRETVSLRESPDLAGSSGPKRQPDPAQGSYNHHAPRRHLPGHQQDEAGQGQGEVAHVTDGTGENR